MLARSRSVAVRGFANAAALPRNSTPGSTTYAASSVFSGIAGDWNSPRRLVRCFSADPNNNNSSTPTRKYFSNLTLQDASSSKELRVFVKRMRTWWNGQYLFAGALICVYSFQADNLVGIFLIAVSLHMSFNEMLKKSLRHELVTKIRITPNKEKLIFSYGLDKTYVSEVAIRDIRCIPSRIPGKYKFFKVLFDEDDKRKSLVVCLPKKPSAGVTGSHRLLEAILWEKVDEVQLYNYQN